MYNIHKIRKRELKINYKKPVCLHLYYIKRVASGPVLIKYNGNKENDKFCQKI